MLTPTDLAPAANIVRAGVCFGLFWLVVKPENTLSYRRRFWASVVVIAGIGLTGLRPFLASGTDGWLGFTSLFQCIFNLALVALLLLRYRLHMPRDGHPAQNVSAP